MTAPHNEIAITKGLTCCLNCGNLIKIDTIHCNECKSTVHPRKKDSLNRTVALLVASIILLIPANYFPMMSTSSLLGSRSDTILSGVIVLWQTGSYPVAIIVFLASFVTPIFKIVSLSYLCYTCKIKSKKNLHFRIKLYQVTELIGRWSMIDVFVVALLGALIQMGAFATITPELGIIAFASVVILTILAAESFDPRLIWDTYNHE